MMLSPFRILSALAVGVSMALAGCQSYQIVQTNMFSDEDGNVVQVCYGKSETDHVNTFRSPVDGREMEFKSKLVVKVLLPDGDSFKAWQCMNFQSMGTMYKTDSEEWMFLANGFTCVIYHLVEGRPGQYQKVYNGVICEAPKTEVKVNDKWRKMTQDGKGNWK